MVKSPNWPKTLEIGSKDQALEMIKEWMNTWEMSQACSILFAKPEALPFSWESTMDALIPTQPELGRVFFLPPAPPVPTTKGRWSELEVAEVAVEQEEELLPEAGKNEVAYDRKTIDIANC